MPTPTTVLTFGICSLAAIASAALAANPWADAVVSFTPGVGGSAGFSNPETCLGPPERYTGEASAVPTVVSPFSPAWGTDELVSIGLGGSLVLAFNEPVRNDADNPWGIDLLLFGNSGLMDGGYPAGLCNGLFGGDGGSVEVSVDGETWVEVNALADSPWATVGWSDAGPYDMNPGTSPSDPVLPVNPSIDPTSVIGLDHESIMDLYASSAGGTGIDLANVGLDAISFVRIRVATDAFLAVEVEALVDVGRWGDATGDHLVTVDDVLAVVGQFGATGGHLADRNHDGLVGVSDLLIVLETWP
jgi:hypothetical protein